MTSLYRQDLEKDKFYYINQEKGNQLPCKPDGKQISKFSPSVTGVSSSIRKLKKPESKLNNQDNCLMWCYKRLGLPKLPGISNHRYSTIRNESPDWSLSKVREKVVLVAPRNKKEFNTNPHILDVYDKKRGLQKILFGESFRSIRKERKSMENVEIRKSNFYSSLVSL